MHNKKKMNQSEQLRVQATEEAPLMTTEEQLELAASGKHKNMLTLAVRYLLPLSLTVVLVWYMFRSVDFFRMMEIIREGVDYWWILLAMFISIFSHVFRAARWNLQLSTIGIKVPFMALCCSIFGCYALNLVFPRLGEVWRCTYVGKTGKAPFTTVLGSMVSERLADMVMVLILTLLAFIIANGAILSFLNEYPIGHDIVLLIENSKFWIAGTICILLIGGVFYFGRRSAAVRALLKWSREIWMGFASLWKMKGRIKFIALTVAIWGAYFIQLYVAFFAFGFTRRLCGEVELGFGLVPCLVAFVLSSIGMAVPSNGGLGPWNIAVMFGLGVYGITQTEGTAFSMLQWSGQTVMLIILGIFTMAYIAGTRNR